MGSLSRAQRAVLTTVIGACVLAAGFAAGRAIGDGDDGSVGQSAPTRISTRQGAVPIPTLGEAKRIPTLEVTEQPVEAPSEESSSPSFTPSPTSEEAESPSPEPSPEPAPEVTVAPNG